MSKLANQLSSKLKDDLDTQLLRFESIAQKEWYDKPIPEKWSKIEILGHLVDSALNNIQRFIKIQYDDQTNIFYDQDFWVKANDYQNQETQFVITFWKNINTQIVNVWKNIQDDQLSKTIPVKDENPTLLFLMEDYILHMQHHLRKINS
ncbi:MAG: DinB family protein [Reichenbachiella sp.]